jgi:photosystem II stability/assembly factor-like uncharacterized protein
MRRIAGFAVGAVLVGLLLTGMGWANPGSAQAGGEWSSVDSATLGDLGYVRFFDADHGVVLDTGSLSRENTSLLTTSSAGNGWTVTDVPTLGDGIEEVFFLDAQHGWACDPTYTPEEPDYILRTVDGGKTWTRVEQPLPKLGATLFFVDTEVGYAVGASSQHWGGGISKTTDGGLTWHDAGGEGEQAPGEEALDDVFFVNAQEGWTVGWHCVLDHNGHGIYHTTDGGDTWERQYGRSLDVEGWPTDAVLLSDVFFADAQHGWVLGAPIVLEGAVSGFILRTDDGGDTWDKVVIPGSGVFSDLCFVDRNAGWVVGEGGAILRTEDGGRTWTAEDSGTTADFHSVSFTDATHGWAVGEWGTVLRYSTDPHTAPFSDTESSPYRQSIESLARAGVIGGYDDGTCRPKNTLLRAQFAKIIDGALGFTVTEDLTSRFVDLGWDDPLDLYPHEYVAMGCMKDIILGKTATNFEPFRPVLRAQAMSMAWRGVVKVLPGVMAHRPDWFESTWGDFSPEHGYNVAGAEYNGLLSGLPLAALDPWGAMTREEAAQLLNNVRMVLAGHAAGD